MLTIEQARLIAVFFILVFVLTGIALIAAAILRPIKTLLVAALAAGKDTAIGARFEAIAKALTRGPLGRWLATRRLRRALVFPPPKYFLVADDHGKVGHLLIPNVERTLCGIDALNMHESTKLRGPFCEMCSRIDKWRNDHVYGIPRELRKGSG